MKPWPPAFAGEPIPHPIALIMTRPLRWEDVNDLAAWARAIAYYASGVQPGASPAVRIQSKLTFHFQIPVDATRSQFAGHNAYSTS